MDEEFDRIEAGQTEIKPTTTSSGTRMARKMRQCTNLVQLSRVSTRYLLKTIT